MGLLKLFEKGSSEEPIKEEERPVKKIKKYSMSENEKPPRTEWCSRDRGNKEIDDCNIETNIYGLSFAEMRVIAKEIREILERHGFDIPNE